MPRPATADLEGLLRALTDAGVVFIVVGGWGKEFETAETGDFVLTVQEVAAGGM